MHRHVCITSKSVHVCVGVVFPPRTTSFILCLPLHQEVHSAMNYSIWTPLSCFWLASANGKHRQGNQKAGDSVGVFIPVITAPLVLQRF